jgi:hypothetical protein
MILAERYLAGPVQKSLGHERLGTTAIDLNLHAVDEYLRSGRGNLALNLFAGICKKTDSPIRKV